MKISLNITQIATYFLMLIGLLVISGCEDSAPTTTKVQPVSALEVTFDDVTPGIFSHTLVSNCSGVYEPFYITFMYTINDPQCNSSDPGCPRVSSITFDFYHPNGEIVENASFIVPSSIEISPGNFLDMYTNGMNSYIMNFNSQYGQLFTPGETITVKMSYSINGESEDLNTEKYITCSDNERFWTPGNDFQRNGPDTPIYFKRTDGPNIETGIDRVYGGSTVTYASNVSGSDWTDFDLFKDGNSVDCNYPDQLAVSMRDVGIYGDSEFDPISQTFTATSIYTKEQTGGRIQLYLDDKPLPANAAPPSPILPTPTPSGSRDDTLLVLQTLIVRVCFPQIQPPGFGSHGTPVRTNTGYPATNFVFKVVDQWGDPMAGVLITEDPKDITDEAPGYDPTSTCIASSLVSPETGFKITEPDGKFDDLYGCNFYTLGKTIINKNTYSAQMGTFYKEDIFNYYVITRFPTLQSDDAQGVYNGNIKPDFTCGSIYD